jgi:hypothetical protein
VNAVPEGAPVAQASAWSAVAPARAAAGRVQRAIPHYAQTLDFTCGPSSLIMAMKALEPALPVDRVLELQLWREATYIFSTGTGHGGCGPYGLALAAERRGFAAEIHVSHPGLFLESRIRDPERLEVRRVLQERDVAALAERGIPVHHSVPKLAELESRFADGWIPLVLVSTFYLHGDHVPHWVVITGFAPDAVRINDPWVDRAKGRRPQEMTDVPIPRRDFGRMARFGRQRERAVVLIGKPAARG